MSDKASERKSIFDNSVLAKYVFRGDAESGEGSEDISEEAAFECEAAQALRLEPMDCDFPDARFELIRPFIIKTLVYLCNDLNTTAIAPVARVIETLALHPEIEVARAISELAEFWGTNADRVSKHIGKVLNVYDPKFIDKFTALTCTNPFTARDAICDLAVYVRTKYYKQYHVKP